MPHLAVVAFTVIAIILILIFVRFRFDKRFAKIVYLALDALIFVCLNCVDSYLFSFFGALKVLLFRLSKKNTGGLSGDPPTVQADRRDEG